MAQQVINIGTVAGDGTGDSLRESQRKSNENFSEIYTRYAPNLGVVTPTDTPAGTGINYWECIEAGTYTNFGGVVLGANSRGTIFRNLSGVFSISQVAYDVSGKVNVSDVINTLVSTETAKPLSAAQGKALNDRFGSYATNSALSVVDNKFNDYATDAEVADIESDLYTAISAVTSGSPKGTYANLAALQAAFPSGNANIYVTTNDGHWHYYNAGWQDGGLYQAPITQTIKSNESLTSAQRKGDVLHGILDQYTGEQITLSKVTGTPTVDGVIYFQVGDEYFKRVENNAIKSKTFGELPISNLKIVKDLYEGKPNTFLISNQAEFYGLNTIITNNAIAKIVIKGGIYEYNEAHIYLNNLDGKDISISSAIGEEVNIISKGEKYHLKESIEDKKTHFVCDLKNNTVDFRAVTFIDENLNDVPKSSTGIRKAISFVTIVDSVNKIGKFTLPSELSYIFNKDTAYFKNSTLRFSSLWRLNICEIISSDAIGVLYFKYEDSDANFNNLFNNAGLIMPQFSIDNIFTTELLNGVTVNSNKIYIPKNVLLLHANKNGSFLVLDGCNNARFDVKNLNFVGSALNGYNAFKTISPLFGIYNTNNFKLSDNTFKNQGSYIISGYENNALEINNNTIEARGTIGEIYGNNVSIHDNKINGGKFYNGLSLLQTCGTNVNIYRNVIKNYIYNSISLNNYGRPLNSVSGDIYENLIFNEDDFSKNPVFALNDGGAIYVTNIHSGVINVYDNVVHDIQGNDFSGIYLDDGASNINVKNNLIYNINDTSISARNAGQIGTDATVAACVNVNIEHNILSTFPWIGTSLDTNNCTFNNNVLLNPNYAPKKSMFNYYNYKITTCNYSFTNNKYSRFGINNKRVSLDDTFSNNRGSFISSFLGNNYPETLDYLKLTTEKVKTENINLLGTSYVYTPDAKYNQIDFSFVREIADVSVSLKMKVTTAYCQEDFLISLIGGNFIVDCLTDPSVPSNKNKETLAKIEAKIFPKNDIYNSGLSIFLKHSPLAGVIEYTFSDLFLRGDFDILDNNLFVKHNGLVDSLPGGTTNIYTGFFGMISGTTAELDANTRLVRTGHLFYNTDLQRLLQFSVSSAGPIWLAVSGNSGTFANKPTSTYATIGHQYYCTDKQTTEGLTNGIPIFHKGSGVWVDALGRVVT